MHPSTHANESGLAGSQDAFHAEVLGWARRLPWWDQMPVAFGDIEGYAGDGVLATRTGPWDAMDFDTLAHEMAHAVEGWATRGAGALEMPGWGLAIRSAVRIPGKEFHEPRTAQASARECAVVGIQKHVMEMAGHPAAAGVMDAYANLLSNYMPDWCRGGDTKAQRLAQRRQWMKASYARWSPAAIEQAWREHVGPGLARARALAKPERTGMHGRRP